MYDTVWHRNDFAEGDRLIIDNRPCVVVKVERDPQTFKSYPLDVELFVVHDDGSCTEDNPCLTYPQVAHTDYEIEETVDE